MQISRIPYKDSQNKYIRREKPTRKNGDGCYDEYKLYKSTSRQEHQRYGSLQRFKKKKGVLLNKPSAVTGGKFQFIPIDQPLVEGGCHNYNNSLKLKGKVRKKKRQLIAVGVLTNSVTTNAQHRTLLAEKQARNPVRDGPTRWKGKKLVDSRLGFQREIINNYRRSESNKKNYTFSLLSSSSCSWTGTISWLYSISSGDDVSLFIFRSFFASFFFCLSSSFVRFSFL